MCFHLETADATTPSRRTLPASAAQIAASPPAARALELMLRGNVGGCSGGGEKGGGGKGGGVEGPEKTVTVCVAATSGLATTVMPRAEVAAALEDNVERSVTATCPRAAELDEATVASSVTLPDTTVTETDEAETLAMAAMEEARAAREAPS